MQVVNEALLVWSLSTVLASLVLSQASNYVVGCYIMTCARIASLRPLMKHSIKKESNRPSVQIANCSKATVKPITMSVWHNFVKRTKW